MSGKELSEQGDNALRMGDTLGAILLYRQAIRAYVSEAPPACPDCGGPETYWPHILIGKIMALEIARGAANSIPQPSPYAVIQLTPQ